MELTGRIAFIGQTETVGNGFTKRLLLLDTKEQFSQRLPIEFVKDKVSKLDAYGQGQEVTVSINLRGSEYNGKHYAQIQGWQIKPYTGQ